MARSIAGATVSFGLVSIPVKLYTATRSSGAISFHLLHEKCGTRLKQQYICPHDEEIVPRDDMVKGYEFAKDQYVTFTPAELKAMEEKATQTVDINEFVPLDRVDPVYFDKPYYLAPEKGGEKAYRLLAQAMKDSNRAALARYAARGKQYLVMLRPAEGAQGGMGIVMQTLLYADEVQPFAEVPMADGAPPREGELKLARQLIDQIASDTFDPTQYEDEVKKRVEADIQRKVEGKEIEAPAPAEEPTRVIDLMEALKASLAGKKRAEPADAAPRGEAAPAGKAAARKPARRSTAAPEGKSEAKRSRARR